VNTPFAAIDAAAAAGVELLLVHHTSWPYIDRSPREKSWRACASCVSRSTALTRRSTAEPEVLRVHDRCTRVGIVPGAGGLTSWLDEARELGCDTYLTGEGSMHTRLFAMEAGLNLIMGGHYRTEAPGIRGLAAALADELDVGWTFVEDVQIG
jgi:putative NIF3 family GTP cyclohydrolase 1 type 2